MKKVIFDIITNKGSIIARYTDEAEARRLYELTKKQNYKKMWNVLRKILNDIRKSWKEHDEIYRKNGRSITPYYHYTRISEIMDELEGGNRNLNKN